MRRNIVTEDHCGPYRATQWPRCRLAGSIFRKKYTRVAGAMTERQGFVTTVF